MAQKEEYNVKKTKPVLGERWPHGGVRGGAGWIGGERAATTYDLVVLTHFLYVRVVRARDLPPNPISSSCDPYVEVKIGNYKGKTRHFEKKNNPEWREVFAFSNEHIQSSELEVIVRDKEMVGRDEYLGKVVFDLTEVPKRIPPDSPLAPQWYRLQDRSGERKVKGQVMVAVWMGTQADEAFAEAWHSDAAAVSGEGVYNVRSKVYVSPKLWYLRVNVIEAQDVESQDKNKVPEVFVKGQIGNQILKTSVSSNKGSSSPFWNEDLVFVAAEPFEELLVLTVENKIAPSKDELVGRLTLPLHGLERRTDHHEIDSQWYNLEKYGFGILEADRRKEHKFSTRIHLRICLEGGYHVLDESSLYMSDQRPTAHQMWKKPIGIFELGILNAQGLIAAKNKDGQASTDAYCVAKYGRKWVRTRTILQSLSPKWNEQYTWEVYDPCTVITLGVFDNCNLGASEPGKDSRIGKVRIRLSTLETDRIYTHSYPLIVLQASGLKKTGELHLAFRFTCLSFGHLMHLYGRQLLPKMHYLHPFSVNQLESLRHQAMSIVASRLERAEPPLRKEVVEYMLDVDSHMWSMRRSKANFFRIVSLFSGVISITKWLGQVCEWKNPMTTILVHILFCILIFYPELILPTAFLYMLVVGAWNFRMRPRHPPHMDTKISWADGAVADELDEEFDTFPTTKPPNILRLRYDRLRSMAGRIQTVLGDIATQGERFVSLLEWRDPRATAIFMVFCIVAAIALYITPFRILAIIGGFAVLRHPRFRSKLPPPHINFFRRLPSRADCML